SRTSGENLFALFLLMARILSRVRASAKPGAIHLGGQGALCVQEIVIDVHRAPPGGGRRAMLVN
ncbi:hypothetical protein, partial [Ralstonia sp. GV074]